MMNKPKLRVLVFAWPQHLCCLSSLSVRSARLRSATDKAVHVSRGAATNATRARAPVAMILRTRIVAVRGLRLIAFSSMTS